MKVMRKGPATAVSQDNSLHPHTDGDQPGTVEFLSPDHAPQSLVSVDPDSRVPVAAPATHSFRVNNFDLLRILAATQVLIIHSMARLEIPVPPSLRWLEWFPGVPIFFVISGYLVSASFERQSNITRYLRNRFLRIYPGLWACIGLTFIVAIALGFMPGPFMDFVWPTIQLLGFIFTPHLLQHIGSDT